jgi:hypothetical protein
MPLGIVPENSIWTAEHRRQIEVWSEGNQLSRISLPRKLNQ